MISPNSAFAEIRDNEHKFFTQALVILIFTSVLSGIVFLPLITIQFDESYFEGMADDGFPPNDSDILLFIGAELLSGIIFTALLYFIGKKIGGNDDWKKSFSVIFHTYVPSIPFFLAISILLFLMLGSFAEIDPSVFQTLSGDEDKILSVIGPMLGYAGLLVLVTIAFVIWIIIITVKAVKTLNGFGTGKAFGLVILVMLISSIVAVPLGL